jgi:hypothetical protein
MVTIEMQKTHVNDICVLFVLFCWGKKLFTDYGLGSIVEEQFLLDYSHNLIFSARRVIARHAILLCDDCRNTTSQ